MAISLVGWLLGMLLGPVRSWMISARLFQSVPAVATIVPVVSLAFHFSVAVGVNFGV